MTKILLLAVGVGLLVIVSNGPAPAQSGQTAPAQSGQTAPAHPKYTADERLEFPAEYREWIFLSSGVDMSYGPGANMGHSMFDNVFVNPEAYKAFQQTGTWPDKTMLVLEVRGADTKGSINKNGKYQNNDMMGAEVHVKDEARFPGKWAFFGFGNDGKPAKMIPLKADCYSCHQQHGAVDTTFVQFYPTLLEVAKKKGTLSAGYVKEAGN
ncbi:MAG: cytochrome P460 family protein [Terriglobales bacterium]